MKTYIKQIQDEIGQRYWLGRVVEIHELSDYGIVEYLPFISVGDKSKGVEDLPMFSAYLKGKSIGHSYNTLEAAIVGVIAYRYDGANSQACSFFIRMISNANDYPLKRHYKDDIDEEVTA